MGGGTGLVRVGGQVRASARVDEMLRKEIIIGTDECVRVETDK